MSSFGTAPDYVAIGHFTIDRLPWGETLGGTVLYAALTAARFGLRAAVLTRGNLDALSREQRNLLETLSGEVEFVIQGSDQTTTFTNEDVAGRRRQTLHAWAGKIDLNGLPPDWRSAPVIHLGPVANELDHRAISRIMPGYLGVTPQGWMRRWPARLPGLVRLEPLRIPNPILARFDALVIAADELVAARDAFEAVGRQSLAVVTRGRQGATVIDRGRASEVRGYPAKLVDATGAGDVFAATLFMLRARPEPITRSLRFASAAAALSVTGKGLDGVPSGEEVEAFFEAEEARP